MKAKHILFLIIIVFIISCKNKNEVHILSKNFESEVEQQQNLVFKFDRKLVPDSLIDRWDTISYIDFQPEVEGKFKWTSADELVFSPVNGFLPSTDYKAWLTTRISEKSENGSVRPDASEILFHTPYLKLMSVAGYWSASNSMPGKASLSLTMNFNYEIHPSDLFSLLKIKLKNEYSEYSRITMTPANSISIMVDGIEKEQIDNLSAEVQIARGLKCSGSKYATTDSIHYSLVVPSPDKLEISDALGEYSGTETVIHVYTNQAVDENGIDKLISIDPKINYTVERIADGFYVKGNFTEGLSYQLSISKELKGSLGGKMGGDFSRLIAFGAMEPSVSFVSEKGIYLSSQGTRNVALNIINIPKIHVSIHKIYENNILHYLRNNRYRNYDYYDEEGITDENNYEYNNYNGDLYGNSVFERYYETKDLPKVNGARLLNLSFDEGNQFRGIYYIDVSSSNSLYKRASKLISISDIGLITKKTEDEIFVFANSIKNALPVSGVTVSFISSNNQILFSSVTDGDGVAVFRNVKARAKGFEVAMITAKAGEDFNYLVLNDTRINDSRFDVGGRRMNPSGSMAFLYGDRNIYRPGETIYLNTVVLDEKWTPLASVPVKLKLILPNGKDFKTIRGTLNKQGAFSTSFSLPVSALTGTYVAEVYTANDVLLESKDIGVEEFMPDRIDVKLSLNKEQFIPGDSVIALVKANNLFGPPASDRKYEAELSITSKYFSPANFPGYVFGLDGNDKLNFPKQFREGRTDKEGTCRESFPLDTSIKGIGLLEGKLFSTVFDETGRPVNRVKKFEIFTQNVFFGIKNSETYVNARENVFIPLIAVNKEGKAISSKARIKIVRHDWYSVIERSSNGGFKYVSRTKERVMHDEVTTIKAEGYRFNFLPRESGQFEIRVSLPESEHFVSSEFYAYGYGYTSNNSFAVNTEGEVEIKMDKEKYNPGDQAEILFTTPFGGKLLVTVECDKVLEYYYLNTDKKTAKLKLPVKENYMPNVYITATLFRPLDDGSIPLTVGHGFAPLIVNPDRNKLPVSILAPSQSRSKSKQTITVRSRPMKDIEMTIAVVDEGILQLKNYKTPDPYAFFYQKKALAVSAHDLYPALLPDIKLKRSSTGGDAESMEKRVNPLTNKRVKLVSFWSGILHTNAAGEASYTIDIPQFSGALRIMACAYKDKSFGSAEAFIKVADPIVISPSIPRFLSPGDTLLMPVTFTNTTGKTSPLEIDLSVDGGLKMAGRYKQSASLKPADEFRAEFSIIAPLVTGNASVTVYAKAFGETFTDKTEITIRPSTSLLKVSDAGVVAGNSSQTISLKTDFIPASSKTRLIISQNPMVRLNNQLNYLLGYPYGCLEQTTSKAFPQLYYSELVKNVMGAWNTNENPRYYVQEAINKIQSMQLYNGSFSYWPSGVYENWWSTVYAVHFLLEAQKAGYDVNGSIFDRCLSYLQQKAKEHKTETYYYFDESNVLKTKTIAKKENIYSLYVLAMAGKPDISSMNFYKSNTALLARDSRYQLACTFLSVGDRKSFDQLLPVSLEGERSKKISGGSFSSYVRDEGLALNALLENDPDNIQIGTMVRHLSQQLDKEPYLNTQERSFAFLALGKFMKKQSENKVTADIVVDDKTIATYNGKEIILTKGITGKEILIRTNGSGNLYYFVESEGISAGGRFKEEDKYLKVRKNFFSRNGQPVFLNNVRQGDLLVVKITLQNTELSLLENVVVTDMLPAGFEIENPRIGEVADMKWVKDESQPDYFDVRDDRIHFFTSVDKNPRYFYYLVRAVSTGNYTMGPVSADAMYNGEYHSYNGAGVVRIVK